MRYAKILGLLVLAAAALTAFASSASATQLTKKNAGGATEVVPNNELIHAASESAITFDKINVSCNKSTIETQVTDNGGTMGQTVKAAVKTLTFEECGAHTVTVVKAGTLEIHAIAGATGPDGTVTSSGAEVTFLTHSAFLGTRHCIYATNNTDLGRLTSSRNTSSTATLDIASAPIPRVDTDSLCPDSVEWTGNYKVTAPDYLDVDN